MNSMGSRYVKRDGHTPHRGDLIFIREEGSKQPVYVGIVTSADSSSVSVILGDSGNAVASAGYSRRDSRIMGYMDMQTVMQNHDENYRAPEEKKDGA